MRQKVWDYLEKPSKKLLAELTTMEQKFVNRDKNPDPKPSEKPKK